LPFFRDKSYYNTRTIFIILGYTSYTIGKCRLMVSPVNQPLIGEEAVTLLLGFDE